MPRRPADPRPPIEVVGAEPDLASTQHVAVGPRAPRGRGGRALAVAGALVGVLLLGLTLGGGDDESPTGSSRREERDNRERVGLKTTTTARGPATTRATTTTTIPVGPVFGQPLEGSLLVFGNGRWRTIDLATGASVELGLLEDNPYDARPVEGGIVVVGPSPGGRSASYYDLRSGSEDPPSVFLGRASQVVSAGSPDRVWLLDGPLDGSAVDTVSRATLVELDGNPLRSFDVPSPYLSGGSEAGVVIGRGGRSYLVDERGPHPLGVGDVLGTSGDALVSFACDDQAACGIELQPFDGGAPTTLDALDGSIDFGYSAITGPEGEIAILQYPGDASLGSAMLFAADGRFLGRAELPRLRGDPSWLPGGLGLVTPSGSGLEWTRQRDGEWVSTDLPALAEVDVEVVHVIP